MNNGANQIQGKFWEIDVIIPANGKEAPIPDQTAINGKNVVTLQVCQNSKNQLDQTLQISNFFIELQREQRNQMTIPANAFANPANPTMFVLNDKTIVWNKSKIVFPATDANARYVKLIAIYED